MPAKHILKRWTKDARDVLPQHLAYLQKDQISVNSITFRHSNTSVYECAMELLKETMHKLTPIAAVHDGVDLEHRIQANKEKAREVCVGKHQRLVMGVTQLVVQSVISSV